MPADTVFLPLSVGEIVSLQTATTVLQTDYSISALDSYDPHYVNVRGLYVLYLSLYISVSIVTGGSYLTVSIK
jgi:hypothetical protein